MFKSPDSNTIHSLDTYSSDLAVNYAKHREEFNETDTVLFEGIEKVGVKDKKVADIGCGDGRHALLIKKLGARQVTGIDINKKMVEMAQAQAGNDNNVDFLVGDGKKLPLADASLDMVVSNFAIHYFAEARDIFNEIARVLKDKGNCVCTFNITDVKTGFEHLYNKEMPIALGKGDAPVIVKNLMKSRKEIADAIRSAGLVIREEKKLDHHNAMVDDSFSDKPHITKHAVMMILEKA